MAFNFNGNNNIFNRIMNLLRYPDDEKQQKAMNQDRVSRFEKAIASTPVFIPLTFRLPASGSISSGAVYTPFLDHDVVITGAITDAAIDRKLNITLPSKKDGVYIIVGENTTLGLKISDYAGGSLGAVNGQKGILYHPAPLRIYAQTRLEFSIDKVEPTDNDEVINIVLIGYRPLQTSSLANGQVKKIESALNLRGEPRTIWLKQNVTFKTAGVGGLAKNVYFPEFEEPVILRGCRTNLKQSVITNIKLQGDADWNTSEIPVWCLAANLENAVDSYIWFQRSIYVPPGKIIDMSFRNSIDDQIFDEQYDNEFAWIGEMV